LDISCPNPRCRKYGKIDSGNIVGNGTYLARGKMLRQFRCSECGRFFNSDTDTAYDGLRTDADKVDRVLKCLNDGMSVRATARTVGCSINSVRRWAALGAAQAAASASSLECGLNPTGIQLN